VNDEVHDIFQPAGVRAGGALAGCAVALSQRGAHQDRDLSPIAHRLQRRTHEIQQDFDQFAGP